MLQSGLSPDIGKATQFRPGESGNPSGRPKKTLLDEAIEQILSADQSAVALKIAKKLLEKAGKGDVRAVQLAAERTQGKPKQSTELSGPGGAPLMIQILSSIPRPVRADADRDIPTVSKTS